MTNMPAKRNNPENKKLINQALPPYHSVRRNIMRVLQRRGVMNATELKSFMSSTYGLRNEACMESVRELVAAQLVTRDTSYRYRLPAGMAEELERDDNIGVDKTEPTPPPYRPSFRPLKGMPVMRCMREGAEEYKTWASVG